MKKTKKGFTIVELVVVIAVIAILAAVLIPTFISVVNRAKVSNDNQLVRNLNTALITEEADGNKAENMSQAISIAEDYGYKLDNLQAKAEGYVLLWNQTTNRFYVKNGTEITSNPEVTDFPAENYTYWAISKTQSAEHSTFLTEGSGDISVTDLGVDVSAISSPVNVNYTGNANKVIIVTNGGELSVNAATGHVTHYGFVKKLTVTAVDTANCYREHGYVGELISFGTGKLVAEKDARFHQTKTEIETAVKHDSNVFEDFGATYGVHLFVEGNANCIIEGCSEQKPDHEHDWMVQTTVAATCTKEGTVTYRCTKEGCNKTKTEINGSALGHSESIVRGRAATCTEDGLTDGKKCSRCEEVIEAQTVIPASGHTEVIDSAIVETCTTTGKTEGKHCSVCNEVIIAQTIIPAKGHDWEKPTYVWTGNSSCTAQRICKNDRNHEEREIKNSVQTVTQEQTACDIAELSTFTVTFDNSAFEKQEHTGVATKAAGEHSWNSGVVTSAATCTTDGAKLFNCTKCSATKTEKISAPGHDITHHEAKAATCTEKGWNAYDTCSRCSYSTYSEIAANGHALIKTEAKSATCILSGNEEYWTCSACNKVYADSEANNKTTVAEKTLPAEGHDWGVWVKVDENNHARTCKRVDCGSKETKQHNINNGTCTDCGYSVIKNGIVDGYYYKDNELYTGSITDGEKTYSFENGKLIIDIASKEYIKHSTHSVPKERVYNYEISSNAYLTKEIIVRGNNSSYDSPATINIIDNSGKNYIVQSVKAKNPFEGLLDKDNWSKEDIKRYLTNANGSSLISDGYKLSNVNILTGYENETDDPDNYDIFIPKICKDSALVESYFSLTGCSDVDDYYNKYNNNSLMISFADYLKLVYGKGYALSNNSGTIEYRKTFGNDYQSAYVGNFYINVVADSSTGLPQVQYVNKNNGEYMTAPTKLEDGKLVFCDYVLDADSKTTCKNGNYLTQLEWYIGKKYYLSISKDTVIMREGSTSGKEVCRFEIDGDNKVIKTYINGTLTDVNGVPYSIPSSGTITLVNGKISLTGVFDVAGVSISVSALSGLVGSQNGSDLMFEEEMIEIIIKAAYLNALTVICGDNEYDLNSIPASVFTKANSVWTATLETNYSSSALNVLGTNIFNGVDIAGTSYEIIMEVSE